MAAAMRVFERCRIVASSLSTQQKSTKFPLTFFDIEWLDSIPMEQVLMYQFPCSKTHFLNTIVPNLKNSLSQALQHYLPFAGNIIFPPNSGMPYIQFQPGDSVDVIIAEYYNSDSIDMFSYLAGNQPREVDKFYALVPALPGARTGSRKVGNFAVQLTLFPGSGISVGWTTHHAAADVCSVVEFLKMWGVIARLGEGYLAASEPLPFHDRSAIKDPITSLESGYSLSDHFWNQIKNTFQHGYPNKPPPRKNSDHVRATFVLNGKQIQNLKNLVLSIKPALTQLSSFTVSCAYVWTCMSRMSEEVEEEELEETIIFPMDARARMHSAVPTTYFGNCLAPGKVVFKLPNQYSDLERMVLCAELIGEFIKTSMEKGPAILSDADHWLDGQRAPSTTKRRILAVVASPIFNVYDVDFGWGTPTKCEVLCTDIKGNMSLNRSTELDGGLEIGLSWTKVEMDNFALLFSNGLEGKILTPTRSMSKL